MAKVDYTEQKTKIIGGVEITLPDGITVTVRTQMNDFKRAYLYAGNSMDIYGLLAVVHFPNKEEYFAFLNAFDAFDNNEW